MNQTNVTEHTGFPNPATDRTLASLDISKLLIKNPASTFFMRIEGHRWERFGIFNGDIAIIDRAISPEPNDLTVWWDEHFRVNRHKNIPIDALMWGTVISIVHRYKT